ncbi:MAG: hypothetical protein NTV49_09530, partial [Kiritimatiellaeota bacterium]|nr:hypothetical protein [Kiritimatiellota bacterium]
CGHSRRPGALFQGRETLIFFASDLTFLSGSCTIHGILALHHYFYGDFKHGRFLPLRSFLLRSGRQNIVFDTAGKGDSALGALVQSKRIVDPLSACR